MKREIKFRAWDGTHLFLSPNLSEGAHHLASWFEAHSAFGIKADQSVFMQYTGLKDKNGKEIYEGDILMMRYFLRSGSIMILVKIDFHGGAFWFSGDGYTDCNWHFYNAEHREIIGNIYEHPHLLNKDQEVKECDATGDDSSKTA